mgnify:CR=1 FL=1
MGVGVRPSGSRGVRPGVGLGARGSNGQGVAMRGEGDA